MTRREIEELQNKMTFNENGEGEIGGKTIRELEAENMQKIADEYRADLFDKNFRLTFKKRFHKEHRQIQKMIAFLNNNTEIIAGIVILLLFVLVYLLFRTDDQSSNSSLLSGLFSGLGAIIAILLSISFSKRSNERTLDSSVLPYIIIKKEKELPGKYTAFEFFSDEEKIFTGWRQFDYEKIKDNKRLLVRNGIAYLHLTNIGLGPAKKICIQIDNFGFLILEKDYLQPNETMDIILNFNNPEKSQNACISIEYETIRNIRHVQKFNANITWHLDRTNFTLFI